MFTRISGPVVSIRSTATTHVGGSGSAVSSRVRHETCLRIADQTMHIRSDSLLDIQAGDEINVAVLRILGANRVVAWHVPSTGARGTVGSWECLILSGVGIAGLYLGISHQQPVGSVIGVAVIGVSCAVALLQARARAMVS